MKCVTTVIWLFTVHAVEAGNCTSEPKPTTQPDRQTSTNTIDIPTITSNVQRVREADKLVNQINERLANIAKNTNYKEARNLLHDFETNYSRTLVQLDDRFKLSAADESVQIQIRNVPVLDNSRSTFRTAVVFDDDETSVNLESIRVNASLGRTKTRIKAVVTKWKNLGKYIQLPSSATNDHFLPINTSLITTTYYDVTDSSKPAKKLSLPVEIEVDLRRDFSELARGRPPQKQVIGIERSCEYWTDGGWSPWGCQKTFEVNGKKIICRCNHTSTFATLLTLRIIEVPQWTTQASVVLQAASIMSLCLTIVLLLTARASQGLDSATMPSCNAQTRNNRTATQICLCASLIVLHATSLSAASAVNDKTACYALAALQHLFLLTSALWLLNEGVAILLKTNFALKLNFRLLTAAQMLVAWGVPLVLVSVTMAVFGAAYIRVSPVSKALKHKDAQARVNYTGGSDFPDFNQCWLNRANGAIYTAIAPTALVVLANIAVILKLVVVVFQMNAMDKQRCNRFEALGRHAASRELWFTTFKAYCLLLPVSALPWVFWLLTDLSPFLMGVHTVINGVQGIGVFLIFCVFAEDDRKRLIRLWNRSAVKRLLTPASKIGLPPKVRQSARRFVPPRSPMEFDSLDPRNKRQRGSRMEISRGSNVTVMTNFSSN